MQLGTASDLSAFLLGIAGCFVRAH